MNAPSPDASAAGGCFLLAALFSIPLGIGLLLGAGWGWLLFGLLCAGLALQTAMRGRAAQGEDA